MENIITSINFTYLSDGLRLTCTYSQVQNSKGLGKAVKQNATSSFVVLDESVKATVAKLFELAKNGISEQTKD